MGLVYYELGARASMQAGAFISPPKTLISLGTEIAKANLGSRKKRKAKASPRKGLPKGGAYDHRYRFNRCINDFLKAKNEDSQKKVSRTKLSARGDSKH